MPVILENFEDADYAVAITGPWQRTTSQAQNGSWSLTNPDIGDLDEAEITVTVPPGAAYMRFWYRVDSEPDEDFLSVYVDDVMVVQSSGAVTWTQSPLIEVTGASTVAFRYSKGVSTSVGADAAWIDNLTFTSPGTARQSFNSGAAGAAITTGGTGGGGDAITNVQGSPAFAASPVHGSSGFSAVNSVSGSDTHIDWVGVAQPGDVFCVRAYLYRTGSFTGFRGLFALIGLSGIVSKAYMLNDNRVYVYTGPASSNVATSGVAIPANQWVRLEFRYTINAAGNGTVEVWTYLNAESTVHSDYVTSATVAWPGGKPRDAEFHLTRETSGLWYLDDIAIGPTKLGPLPITRSAAQTVNANQTQPITRIKRQLVGQVVEQDTAWLAKAVRQRTVGAAVESAATPLISRIKMYGVGPAAGVSSASVVRPGRVRTIGNAVEQAAAGVVVEGGGIHVSPVAEIEAASPITAVKARRVAPAAETTTVNVVRPAHRSLLATAAEMNAVVLLARAKHRSTGQAIEVDTAVRISGGFLATTIEADAALLITPLLYRGGPFTGVDGPRRQWGAGPARRGWSADPARRTWSASTHT